MANLATPDDETPFFSIIIPTYNRRREVARAVASVLGQEFRNFEVIVVDDGSTDGSGQVIEALCDARLRTIKLARNCGVCPARNAGVDRARGEWIIFLDSDDELTPDALERLQQRINEAPLGVDRIASAYRWDDGSLSPDPLPKYQVLDYSGYLSWSENLTKSDFHNTIRRTALLTVRLPESRAYEGIFHLDFSRQFRTWFVPDVIALAHQDAPNRTANLSVIDRVARMLRDAPDSLLAEEQIIARHGAALQKYSPFYWRTHHRARILFSFLTGERARGLKHAWSYTRLFGLDLKVVFSSLLGVLGPKPLAWVYALR